jgi:hypothetical protein
MKQQPCLCHTCQNQNDFRYCVYLKDYCENECNDCERVTHCPQVKEKLGD